MGCLLRIAFLLGFVSVGFGSYVITTPRKWPSGEEVQVCLFAEGASSSSNTVRINIKSTNGEESLAPEKILQIPEGKQELCCDILVPDFSQKNGVLHISGDLGGSTISQEKNIQFSSKISKTFVQTDKFLYKPSQEVQFRILTITGPFLKISNENYPLIWVETPSGTRIAQWTDVENSSGLIHLSFKLSDEPEEGSYKISVRPPGKASPVSQTFKVEEFVLPRFEVQVKKPNFILATAEEITFNVCAEYTYGQPVKGDLRVEIDNGGYWCGNVKYILKDKIFGCKDVVITAEDIQLNGPTYFVERIKVKATVVEEGTGESFEGTAEASVARTALRFKSIGKEEYLKPNLPYTGKIKVEWPDGSAASHELMETCLGSQCKNISTGADGILEFIVPSSYAQSIYINSVNYPYIQSPDHWWRPIMYESSYRKNFRNYRYFSPSNSSLVIHAPDGTLPCQTQGSHEHILPVLFSASDQPKAVLTVQVISRGQIQYSKTTEYELLASDLPINAQNVVSPMPIPPEDQVIGVIKVPISLPSTASPSAKVVVWYSRDDGEIVSDTKEISVSKCYTNPVGLKWSIGKVQPGEQATLDLSAEPKSTCSLGVVDKSVELLSSQDDTLTLEKVFELVEQAMVNEYDNSQVDDYEYCINKDIESDTTTPPTTPGSAFEGSEPVTVLSDDPEPYWWYHYYSDYVDALKMFDKSGLYFITDLTTETRPCVEVFGEQSPELESGLISSDIEPTSPVPPDGSDLSSAVRTYFPETWLWELFSVSYTGVNSQNLTLPDTITEWVGEAICVHPEKGLGVSYKASITTFTPFFTDLTLPPSVKRGEILPVKISVFNYLQTDLPVQLVLEESSEYEILPENSSENKILPEESSKYEILPKESSEHESSEESSEYEISPKPLGSKKLSGQRSACVPLQDKVVHTIRIRPTVAGNVNITVNAFVDEMYPEKCGPQVVVSKRDVQIKPIKVEVEGFLKEKTWTKYICTKDLKARTDFLESWQVEAPSNIVPDSARGWVTAVGDLLGPTLENLGSLVRMPFGCGEQNMLNFAPNIFILQYLDASNQATKQITTKAIDYMKHGYQRQLRYRHEDGSYSAFGSGDPSGSTWLTAFVLKSFAQARQYIQIDQDDLKITLDWLKLRKMENGCFESVGKIFHKGMKGGIAGTGSPVPLAAYALISLLEAGEPTTSKVISEAASCLHADGTFNPYTEALKAYALALSQEANTDSVLEKLISAATETSNSMHWELPKESGMSDAVAVETAGYVILAMMTLNAQKYDIQAMKIVKWITSQRNGQGGFISTQDTVVALQALASFEAHQNNQGGVNLVVTLNGTGLEHAFFIDESNKLLQQTAKIPSIPNSISLGIEGTGCALVQAVLRYNLPEPPPSEAFSLTVETTTPLDEKGKTKKIKICSSYQHPDGKSNMAVIEVDLVSGYIPEKADLKQIVGNGAGLFKRYEVDGSKVTFYLDEISNDTICLEFRILREVDMEDVKPGKVTVYDYYQTEYSVNEKYILPPNDECVSGSTIITNGITTDSITLDETTIVPDIN